MASDDEARQKELERERLIQEIRRRAEEAELKRIEDEERRSATLGSSLKPVPPAPDPAPPAAPHPPEAAPPAEVPAPPAAREPEPSPELPPAPQPSPVDQRIAEIREKLDIALDRGLSEKAAPLLTALSALLPDDPLLATYTERLAAVEHRVEAKSRKRQPEPRSKEDAARARADREAQRKKIGEGLERANSFYQQEKYDRALEEIDGILALDPELGEALTLKTQVEKARTLAEQIREEEARRRAAEGAKARPAPAPAPPPRDSGSVWGQTLDTTETQTVFEAPEEKAAAVIAAKTPLAERFVRRASGIHLPVRTLVTAGAVLVVGLLIYLVVDAIRNTVFPPKYSLLVYPATSNVTDGSLDYLSEGISEGLISDLSFIREFRLIGLRSSQHFLDPRTHTAATARALGVSTYLTWSIDRAEDMVSVQASLYDTVDAAPRWTMTYERSFRELPALRREMARAILKTMEVEMTAEEEARLRPRATTPADAQESYLRARFLLHHASEGLLDSALAQFELARILDPGSAETQSGIGWARILSYERDRNGPVTELHAALRCVQAAVGVDPSSAEALRVWALVSHYSGEHAKALARMEEAVRLAPSDAETQRRLAILLVVAGRPDDALKAAETARALDPFNEESFTVAGLVRNYRGQFAAQDQAGAGTEFSAARENFDAGMRLARDRSLYAVTYGTDVAVYLQQHDRAAELLTDRVARVRDSAIDFYRLGRVLQSGGKPVQQWQEMLRRAGALLQSQADPLAQATLALVHTRLGEFKEAAETSARALAAAPEDVDVLYATARMYALQRGSESQALATLAKAVDKRYSLVDILDMDFFNLRSDPGFLPAITR